MQKENNPTNEGNESQRKEIHTYTQCTYEKRNENHAKILFWSDYVMCVIEHAHIHSHIHSSQTIREKKITQNKMCYVLLFVCDY